MQKKINYKTYYDKVLGGWIGKCAGGILGAPIEGYKKFNTIPFSEKLFETNFANDDLDLQVLWLDMLLKKGNKVRATDFNKHWEQHVEFPWCEYGIATRNMAIGLDNPNTGNHNNWYWNSGMGSPIRSEIWGMVNPGNPENASKFAKMDSELDHYGFSVEAEQYLSACASIAFFEYDMKVILKEGLNYIPSDCDCKKLINNIFEWDAKYDYNIVAGKIKSFYGDADFTNAPMNIAFTVLSLLHTNNSFDFLIDAFHLGHDSDCVVATAGALLGIVLGYDNIPDIWKARVGNELLVSPEIVGIYCPATLSELTELTCKAGINFIEDSMIISDYPSGLKYNTPEKLYDVHVDVIKFPKPHKKQSGIIKVIFENLTSSFQNVEIKISSPYFESYNTTIDVLSKKIEESEFIIDFNNLLFPTSETKIPYSVTVSLSKHNIQVFEKGFPYYGNWLLLGPFIEEDKSTIISTSKYSDHGMSSLPSVVYMNHDLARSDKNYLDTDKISELINEKNVFDQNFHVQVIHPSEMKMNLQDYFIGTGERTIYMYSEIQVDEDITKWLALGCPAYITVWHNGVEKYKNEELIRSWPLAHSVELDLIKGKNTILLRIDATLDDFTLEVGLKEHDNKHPHQCLWNHNLQFNVIDKL